MQRKTLLLLTLLGCYSLSFSQGKILPIHSFQQEADRWCWAACTQMVLDYFHTLDQNRIPSQCEVVSAEINPVSFGGLSTNIDCCRHTNNPACNPRDVSFPNLSRFNMVGTTYTYPYQSVMGITDYPVQLLTYQEVISQIDDQKPIYIQHDYPENKNGISHIILIIGYTLCNGDSFICVNDPFAGCLVLWNWNEFKRGDAYPLSIQACNPHLDSYFLEYYLLDLRPDWTNRLVNAIAIDCPLSSAGLATSLINDRDFPDNIAEANISVRIPLDKETDFLNYGQKLQYDVRTEWKFDPMDSNLNLIQNLTKNYSGESSSLNVLPPLKYISIPNSECIHDKSFLQKLDSMSFENFPSIVYPVVQKEHEVTNVFISKVDSSNDFHIARIQYVPQLISIEDFYRDAGKDVLKNTLILAYLYQINQYIGLYKTNGKWKTLCFENSKNPKSK